MTRNYILIDFENVHVNNLAPLEGHSVKVLIFLGAKQTTVPVELAETQQRLSERVEYVRTMGGKKNALDFHIAFTIGQLAAREPEAIFHVISKDEGYDPLLKHLRKQKLRAFRAATVIDISFVRSAREKQAAATTALRRTTNHANRTLAELALGSASDEACDSGLSCGNDSAMVSSAACEFPMCVEILDDADEAEFRSIVAFPLLPQVPMREHSVAVNETPATRADKTELIAQRLAKTRARPRKLATLRNFIKAQLARGSKTVEIAELDLLIKELKRLGCISVSEKSVTYHFTAAS